jgi:hypothetical protein
MNDIHQHIIARLKQQARHSNIQPTESAADRAARLKKEADLINVLGDESKALKNIYLELNTTIQALSKSDTARATGIGKLIKTQQDLAANMQTLSKGANALAERNNKLQKAFGLSVNSAAALGYELDATAASMKISRGQAEANYKAISKLTGGFGQNVKGLQKLNQYYTVNRGLSQEAADGLLIFASNQAALDEKGKLTEDSLDAQTLAIRNQFAAIENLTGIKGAQLEIEHEIGKATSSTRLTFSKYPGQLGMAVMKAKALGITLSDLETVGDNLLNIESSVGEELNYQLLTGRRLVDGQGKSLTNKYRELYLSGKSEEAAQTLNDIMTQEGDTLEGNMLARQQMAKVLGLELNQVSTIVEKRKLMKNLIDKSTGKALTVDIFSKTGDDLKAYLAANTDANLTTISEIMDKDKSVETPEERSAKVLESIEAKGIMLQMGSAKGAQELINDTAAATEQMITSFGTTMETKFAEFTSAFATKLGKQQISREGTTTDLNAVIDDLFKLASGFGGATGLIADWSQNVLSVTPSTISTAFNGSRIETMTVEKLATPTATVPDGVMINDGIRFNPRDKFRTINDGMTVAGTNVGGLDRYAAQLERRDRNFEQSMKKVVASMAAAVTTAIQRANLTVNIDRTFAGSSLNPRGKFGG